MPGLCILWGSENGFNVHHLNELTKRGEMHPHKRLGNDTRDLNVLTVPPAANAQTRMEQSTFVRRQMPETLGKWTGIMWAGLLLSIGWYFFKLVRYNYKVIKNCNYGRLSSLTHMWVKGNTIAFKGKITCICDSSSINILVYKKYVYMWIYLYLINTYQCPQTHTHTHVYSEHRDTERNDHVEIERKDCH